MIAAIQPYFNEKALLGKLNYHQKKLDKGEASVLFSHTGELSLESFLDDLRMCSSLNDRVRSPYVEFTLNLPHGEYLNHERFTQLSRAYLSRMGYGDTAYAAIVHSDKEHYHVHILASRVCYSGRLVDDKYSKLKSQRISRDLEHQFELRQTEYGRFNTQSLGEINARKYYFHNALSKGIRNYSTRKELEILLGENLCSIAKEGRSNQEYEEFLGVNLYREIGELLDSKGHFRPLYKEELLKTLDAIYPNCRNIMSMQNKLNSSGYYMRMLSKNGDNYIVYGIPGVSFYLKENSLPQKYRFHALRENGFTQNLGEDAQKNYIYNTSFVCLNKSINFEDFKERMYANSIRVIEHENIKGIYGLSFVMMNVDHPVSFRSSDVSRRLTYSSMERFFHPSNYISDKRGISYIADNEKIQEQLSNVNNALYAPFVSSNEDGVDLSFKRKKKKRRDFGQGKNT